MFKGVLYIVEIRTITYVYNFNDILNFMFILNVQLKTLSILTYPILKKKKKKECLLFYNI